MRVLIPSQLRSYTSGSAEIEASGATLGVLLDNIERAHRGLRFRIIDEQDRIRRHIRVFVNGEEVHDLSCPLKESDEVQIVGALTGG